MGISGLKNRNENDVPKSFQAIRRYEIDEWVMTVSTRSAGLLDAIHLGTPPNTGCCNPEWETSSTAR